MSYTKKLTQFTKGNQLSTCGEYCLEDLDDMFCDTQFSNSELYLEDVLTENERGRAYQAYTLTSTVTIMEELDDDEMNMYMLLEDDNTNTIDFSKPTVTISKLKLEEDYEDEDGISHFSGTYGGKKVDEVECSLELDYEFQQQSE